MISLERSDIREKVQIYFNKQPIQHLCRADYVIWNSGWQPIIAGDLKSHGGIEFEFDKDIIPLEFSISKATRPENRVEIMQYAGNMVGCRFHYLDPKHGFNVTILHTGLKSPRPKGVISGVREEGLTMIVGKAWPKTEVLLTVVFFVALFGSLVIQRYLGWPEWVGELAFFLILFGGGFAALLGDVELELFVDIRFHAIGGIKLVDFLDARTQASLH